MSAKVEIELQEKCEEIEKDAVIAAARRGDSIQLEKLLENVTTIELINHCDSKLRRNALHWACDAANPSDAFKCFKLIMKYLNKCCNYDMQLEYIDHQDINNETALHISIKNFCPDITKKLVKKGADMEIKSKDDKTQIELMCKYSRKSLSQDMDNSIEYVGKSKTCTICKENNAMTEEYTFCLHFGNFILFDNDNPARSESETQVDGNKPKTGFVNEMEIIHFFSQTGFHTRKEIYSHPLLKSFLHLKWKKMEHYVYRFMIYYVVWLSLHFTITATIYVYLCPKNANATTTNVGIDSEGNSVYLESDTECDLEFWIYLVTVVLMFATSIIPLCIEILQMIILKAVYFHDIKNYAQMFLILQTVVQLLCFSNWYTQRWSRILASMAVLCGIFLILSQLDEFPGFFKHVRYLKVLFRWINFRYFEVFRNLLKKLCFLLIPFAFLILGFQLAFNILIPEIPHFSVSFESYIKLLALATSQLSYDETFGEDEMKLLQSIHEKRIALALYATFLVVIVLVWFNFLIGVTVSDINIESQNAEINNISVRIGKLFVMEELITYLANYFKFMRPKYEEISLMNSIQAYPAERCMHVHKSELPRCVVQEMRELIARKDGIGSVSASRNFILSDGSSLSSN